MDENVRTPRTAVETLIPVGAFLGVEAFAYLVIRWMRSEMQDGL